MTYLHYEKIIKHTNAQLVLEPDELLVTDGENTTHLYNGYLFTLSDDEGKYWLWTEDQKEDSDPDAINDEPWTKKQIFDYITK